MSFLDKIFGKPQSVKSENSSSLKGRRLGMESLENREMLSVTLPTYVPVEQVASTALVIEAASSPATPVFRDPIISSNAVTLLWDAQDGLTNYTLWYKETADSIWAIWSNPAPNATNETITGLSANTMYDFRLYAFNAYGSSNSTFTLSTTAPAPTSPVFRDPIITSDSVTLSWDAQDGLTNYTLWYKETADSIWAIWSNPAPNATNETITGLSANTMYDFRLYAFNAYGSSNSTFTLSTTAPAPTSPVFRNTTATADSITIEWEAQSNLTGYELSYKKAGIATMWPPATFYDPSTVGTTLPGFEPDTAYDFLLTAVNAYGSASSIVTVRTAPLTAVTAPTSPVFQTIIASTDRVSLSWDAQPGLTSYELLYKRTADTGSVLWAIWPAPAPNATGAMITGLAENTSYDFLLRAINTAGSADSIVTVTTLASIRPGVPATPATASAVSASGNVTKISWSQVDGATSYDIMGYNKAGNYWWKIGTTNGTSYNAQAYSANVTTIAVHAVNSAGRSTGKAVSIFRAPTNVAAVAASGNQTKISWNAVAGAVSYEIMGYNKAGNYWWKIGTTNKTSYTAPGYSANVTTIAVHAIRGSDRTAGAATSISRAPTGVSAVAASGNQTKISWNAVAGATSYEIMGYNKAGNYWWKIGTTNSTSFNASAYSANVTTIAVHALRGTVRTAGTSTTIVR